MRSNKIYTNPYHPDIKLFLVLIPIINCFNYYLTYSNVQLNWKFMYTFCIDVAQGYFAWWILRVMILYLDKRMPYDQGPVKRIILQVVLTTFTGLFIIAITTEILSHAILGKPAIPSFYTFDLVIISIWFFVINGIYVGLFYYRKWEQIQNQPRDAASPFIMVTLGKQNIKLKIEELLAFLIDGSYIMVYSEEGKRYLLDDSLDNLEKKLSPNRFFRINRQAILSRSAISGYRRAEHGKLEIQLNNTHALPSILPMSRLKAPAFRRWFEKSTLK